MKDQTQPGPCPQHLTVTEPDRLGSQMVEIDQVCLGLDPLAPGGSGEGFGQAGIVVVNEDNLWAIAGPQAVQNVRGEFMAGLELVAADDDTHTRILNPVNGSAPPSFGSARKTRTSPSRIAGCSGPAGGSGS